MISHNASKDTTISHNTSKYTTIFHNIPQYKKIYHNISNAKFIETHLNFQQVVLLLCEGHEQTEILE